MDAKALPIVRSIIGLGSSLGIPVTAEGVETEEQLNVLARSSCSHSQGYLFSRPVPANQLNSIVERLSAKFLFEVRTSI